MTAIRSLLLLAALPLAACAVPEDKSADRGIDSGALSANLIAGIWVDPDGCDHWIVDDGVEGYLSSRLSADGSPVCSGVAQPTQIVGPFMDGAGLPDPADR